MKWLKGLYNPITPAKININHNILFTLIANLFGAVFDNHSANLLLYYYFYYCFRNNSLWMLWNTMTLRTTRVLCTVLIMGSHQHGYTILDGWSPS